MSFNIPNTFTAGTKARADKVNENFTSIQDEINKHTENINAVKEDLDYVKKEILDDFIAEAEIITKTNKSKFCINYANVADDGKTPDILSFDESILSFKVGGTYPVLTATNAYGDSETFEYIDNVDITGYADGNYNIFLTLEGNIELLNTKIIKSPKAPVNIVIDDVWLMTLEPWAGYKFNGLSWVEFEDIPLGSLTVLNGKITEVSNYTFNTQYLDADCNFITRKGRENLARRFESEWFNMTPKGVYTFEHNLNIDPLHYRARIVSRITSNYSEFVIGDIIETVYSNFAGNQQDTEVGLVLKFTKNAVTIGAGNSSFHCGNDLGVYGYNYMPRTSVEHKIIITEDIN